jgi:hypothetical protein
MNWSNPSSRDLLPPNNQVTAASSMRVTMVEAVQWRVLNCCSIYTKATVRISSFLSREICQYEYIMTHILYKLFNMVEQNTISSTTVAPQITNAWISPSTQRLRYAGDRLGCANDIICQRGGTHIRRDKSPWWRQQAPLKPSLNLYQATRRNIPGDSHLHLYTLSDFYDISYNTMISWTQILFRQQTTGNLLVI